MPGDRGSSPSADPAQSAQKQVSAAIASGINNQIAHFRHLSEHSDGGRIEETEDYLFFAGAHAHPGTYTNGAIRKTPSIGAVELLARADVFFGALARQYWLWTENERDADVDAVAGARGYYLRPPESGNPCIVRTTPPAPVAAPASYTFERAGDDSGYLDYLHVIARNYELDGMPRNLAEAVLFSIESLRADSVFVLLARHCSGEVHAGISAFLAEDCVGLEWAATDPAARGNGLGSVLVERASAWGFDHGARCAWGVASQLGVPIWRKMGFTVPTHVRRWLAPRPESAPPAPLRNLGVARIRTRGSVG